MAWEDRPRYRDRGAAMRLWEILNSSFRLYTAFGIRVRIHFGLILFIAVELLVNWSYPLISRVTAMAMLFLIVLLHEYGHCFAARAVGGTAEDILLWPFGGLAFPDLPKSPAPHFWTVLAGPAVNFVICLLCAGAVYVLTPTATMLAINPHAAHALVSLNPWNPLPPVGIAWQTPAFYAWWLFVLSYIMLLFNLLPIFPLDGGRLVQAVLWHFTDYPRSMMIATFVGMFGSAGLAVIAIVSRSFFLLVMALMFFYACVRQRAVLRETGQDEAWQLQFPDFSSSLASDPAPRRRRRNTRVLKQARERARQEAARRERIDSILAKVSREGMANLTRAERKALRQATEAQRRRDMELKSEI